MAEIPADARPALIMPIGEAVLDPALNRLICATTTRRALSNPSPADIAVPTACMH